MSMVCLWWYIVSMVVYSVYGGIESMDQLLHAMWCSSTKSLIILVIVWS